MKSGAYSDTPFLVVTAALLQSIYTYCYWLAMVSLFNRFKSNRTTTTKSVNAEETVRQANRASATNEDHNFHILKIMINIAKSKLIIILQYNNALVKSYKILIK